MNTIWTCRQCDNDKPLDIFVHMGETGHTDFNQIIDMEENKVMSGYKYTKCRKCGWSITANDIDQCSRCFIQQAEEENKK